jgi:hypothetical protein
MRGYTGRVATTAHSANNDLAAASLLRAFMADDREAGMLIIEQNGGQSAGPTAAELTRLLIAVLKLANRVLLSANGYDPDKAMNVIDQWMTRLARDQNPPR